MSNDDASRRRRRIAVAGRRGCHADDHAWIHPADRLRSAGGGARAAASPRGEGHRSAALAARSPGPTFVTRWRFGLLRRCADAGRHADRLSLGINQLRMPMIAPFCLNRNGNAISVSTGLYDEMCGVEGPASRRRGPAPGARRLRAVIADAERARAAGAHVRHGLSRSPATPTSSAIGWPPAASIPTRMCSLVVIPPPLMVDNLRDGYVDGFCVGEPWNSLAVDAGSRADHRHQVGAVAARRRKDAVRSARAGAPSSRQC